MAEGYIYSLPKKGFYVSPINNKTPLIPAKMIHNLLSRKSLIGVISLLIRHQPIYFLSQHGLNL